MNYYKNLSLENIVEDINGVIYIEEWKDILGYEGSYQISNFGRIKSLNKFDKINGQKEDKIINQFIRDKYLNIMIRKNKKGINFYVHRLTAFAFNDNPENKREVNHEDGIKTNNFYLNLKWATPKENIQHAIKNKLLIVKGENNPMATLKNEDVMKIFNSNDNQRKLANFYGIAQPTISAIKTGKLWSHLTGKKYIKTKSYARRDTM